MTLELEDHAFLRELLGDRGVAGPGDDAALLSVRGPLLVTVDPLVEGVHYEPRTSPARIARKLVNRNFSDLAAMGARPDAVVASFVFGPGWGTRRRRAFYRAVDAAVRRFDAAWIGGDIATGPSTVFTLTAFGRAAARPVRRSGLRVGHRLFVTGAIGASLASGHHLDFEPRVALGVRIAQRHGPSAMIDISDGLALDLWRMLDASGGLGARLVAPAIRLRQGRGRERLLEALGAGEDYELLFAVPTGRVDRVRADPELPDAAHEPIGTVEAEPGIRLAWPDGRVESIEARGWVHV